MSAADLRAAADRLEALLADATPGPWLSLDHGDRLIHVPHDDREGHIYVVDEPMSNGANAELIATLDPTVGAALVDLVRWAGRTGQDIYEIDVLAARVMEGR